MNLVPTDPSPQLKFVIFLYVVQSSSSLPSLWWMGLRLGYRVFSFLLMEIGLLSVCLHFFSLFSFEVGFARSPLMHSYPRALYGQGLT